MEVPGRGPIGWFRGYPRGVSSDSPELNVVCKNCSAEVSPYVTECPYCGKRIRKRAPKLTQEGDHFQAEESRRSKIKRQRRAKTKRPRRIAAPQFDAEGRPWALVAIMVAAAVLAVVLRATDLNPFDLGAIIVGNVGSEGWRYLAAPFVYDDLGYLFVVGLAFAIFGPTVERRLGLVTTALLIVGAAAIGLLATSGADTIGLPENTVASGGNGMALALLGAWFGLRSYDNHGADEPDYDVVGVAISTLVLIAIPLVEDFASPTAGAVGGLIGLLVGMFAARRGR